MILSDIKRYLQARGSANLSDIALHFDSDPDAVRGMLEQWIRKGKVRRRAATASCGSGGCTQCDPATTEIYDWVGDGAPAANEQPLPTPSFCKH